MTVVQPDDFWQRRWPLDHVTRSEAERRVVEGLRRVGTGLRGGLTIATNVTVEVIPGRFFEVDVWFAHRGGSGVIEIDGPHHRQRRACDASREYVLERGGVSRVFRLTAEATNDPGELDGHLRFFMQRLTHFY